jgi:hypothetical protein
MNPMEVAILMERADVRSSKVGKELARRALEDPTVLDVVVGYLVHEDKSRRAAAAETFAEACKEDPGIAIEYISDLAGVLGTEEPQTRWEALMALSYMSTIEPEAVETAWSAILGNLHDPKSMIVRSSAALCMGRLGATDADRARRVLPHLEDAVIKYENGNELGSLLDALSFIAAAVDDGEVKARLMELVMRYEDHQRASISKRVKGIKRHL